MLKKIFVAVVAIVSTFSVVYSMNRDMSAAISNNFLPTNATGRIGNLEQGDRIYVGTKYKSNNLQMQLLLSNPNGSGANTWLMMSESFEESVIPYSNATSSPGRADWPQNQIYEKSNIKPYFNEINTNIATIDASLIVDRNVNYSTGTGYPFLSPDKTEVKFWCLTNAEYLLGLGTGQVISNKNLMKYDKLYWMGNGSTAAYNWIGINPASGEIVGNDITTTAALRATVKYDLSKIVFSLSTGAEQNFTNKITKPVKNTTNISISTGEYMKPRFENSTNPITVNLQKLAQDNNSVISVSKGESFDVVYDNATVGTKNTISIILTDSKTGEFKYYQPLTLVDSTGIGSINFNTSDIDVGSYNVRIVNEELTFDNDPIYSSPLSNIFSIEIVTPEPQLITYNATPQSQSTYEYDKNVDAGDKVGTLTRSNGVAPIHYELVADGSDTSYKNFEIAGLDSKGNSYATSFDVKVKTTGAIDVIDTTNSLKSGTYRFCIVSKDANGNPVTDVVGQNKICTSLVVGKTTPTISLSDTSQKDMAIGDSAYAGDITYTNTDTVVPGNISYALTNGISGGVLTVVADSVNPKKYNANVLGSYTGTSLPTTFDLNVTIDETDNYKSASTTVKKQFFVYKELSNLIWSPTKTGNYSTADVTANAKVGSLLASDGVEKFTYEFAKQGDTGFVQADAADNSSFTIANGSSLSKGISAEVKTASQLIEKTYKIQFKVTDSKDKVVYKSVEIVVNAQSQNSVDFKTGASGTVITEYKMKVNEKSHSLFAEGGSTGATIEYYLANASDQPSELVGSASDYADIAKIGGLVTPKKVGTVNVYAKSPGNATYGDQVSSFMKLIIEKAEQSVKFANTNATSIKIGDTSQETATGTVTLTNTTGEGGITYKSSDENIATVDANGNVTAIAKGTAIITATLNTSDSSNTSYNPNYETKTTTKTINVYKGMSLTWTASLPNLKGVSSGAGDLAGTISVTDNNGNITYTISSNTGVENADAKFFQLDPNNTSCGVQLVESISAAEVFSHNNKFYIQVDATDSKGTQTIDIEITIDNADNDAYFKEGSNKVTKITKQFGENGNAFNFSVNTSNGGSVTYSIPTSEPQDVITTLGTGVTTIKKVGKTKAQAVIGAGSGYDEKTISVDVEITKGIQEVAFDDTKTTARAFVKDSQFTEATTLTETSEKSTSSRTKTYDSKDTSICTVDQAGLVTMLTKGNCEIEVKNTDSNWTTTTATKTINLYDGMGVVFAQSAIPQAETPSAAPNSIVGKLTISGGQGNKTSIVSTGVDPKNKDSKYFDVKGTNVVLKQNITATDLVDKYDTVKKKYVMYVQFETKDSLNTTITTDAIIEFKGAPLDAEFDTGGTGKITEVYGKDKIFLADVIHNSGDGTPIYQLKNDPSMPSDVLKSVEEDGSITIENANDLDPKSETFNDKPVMIEAVIPPSGGYEGKTIEVEVEIIKAEQKGFKFKTPTIKMQTESTITVILEGKSSTGTTKLISPNTTILSVNGMDITAGKTQDTITLTASDTGDRNYKLATATATVIISEESAYPFAISVPSATYGETGLSATIETNGGGNNRVQTWVSSDPTIADVDENGNITIYKAGQVDITCTQTTTGEPSATSTATLVIQPKPITITINDKSKYVGEAVPGFDMTIPNGVLVSGDTISLPNFSCLGTSNTPVTNTTPAGSYPITGTYPTGANANYAITVTSGTLTLKQDTSLASWFHLEGVTSGNTLDSTKWYSEDVKVVLDIASESAGTYDEISLNQALWDSTSITVAKEDENSEDVYFRINASGILSTSQNTTIKIDKTKPIVKSITGTQTNKDALSTLINNLTYGTFFKQGTLVSIKSENVLPSPNIKVSGVQEVAYEVYEIDRKTGILNGTPLDTGTDIPDENDNIEVKLDDVGLYRVCAIAKDNAGNVSGESCSDVNIKKIDVDIDDDGENEYQDPDNDGCPDINIALKDEKGTIYKINVDRDEDGIPDLNIDSDGDGIADINVDTDKDGKPDLNLVILTKWEPTFCAKEQIDNEGKPIEYCTMKDIKAVINIDTGKDGVPDINIDTNNDMKANINNDREGDRKPHTNIQTLESWKPNNDMKYEEFEYDTMNELKPYLNIDTDGNGFPDINLDTNNDGVADLNIDMGDDGIPDIDIDSNGDGEPDINIDEGGDGIADKNIADIKEWIPKKRVDIIKDFPYDTMENIKVNDTLVDESSGIEIQKPGGSFLPNYSIKVNDVSNNISTEEKGKLEEFITDGMEVKEVLDVKLYEGEAQVEPDGTIKVKLPLKESYQGTVRVVVEQKDGSYKEVDATIEDGYLVYETDYLGKVSIIGDKVIEEDTDKPDVTIPDFKPNGSGGSTPDASVKGNYTTGIGGAGTGDTTNVITYIMSMGIALGMLFHTIRKQSTKQR